MTYNSAWSLSGPYSHHHHNHHRQYDYHHSPSTTPAGSQRPLEDGGVVAEDWLEDGGALPDISNEI